IPSHICNMRFSLSAGGAGQRERASAATENHAAVCQPIITFPRDAIDHHEPLPIELRAECIMSAVAAKAHPFIADIVVWLAFPFLNRETGRTLRSPFRPW